MGDRHEPPQGYWAYTWRRRAIHLQEGSCIWDAWCPCRRHGCQKGDPLIHDNDGLRSSPTQYLLLGFDYLAALHQEERSASARRRGSQNTLRHLFRGNELSSVNACHPISGSNMGQWKSWHCSRTLCDDGTILFCRCELLRRKRSRELDVEKDQH